MINSISFIVLTHFFQFNQLKILRQPGYLFFQVKPTIFFYSKGSLAVHQRGHWPQKVEDTWSK